MRNDPCPCGSGKKFKKCHGSVVPIALQLAGDERRDEFRRAGLAKDADMRLHTDLLRWADRHLPVTWLDEMLEIYLGIEGELSDDDDIPLEEENLWLTWSLYHCPLDNGGTVAEQFRAERDAGRSGTLGATDRAVLDAHRNAALSLWRVVGVEHGIGTELEDLLTSRRVFAYDAASTEGLAPNLVLLAYLLDVGGVHFFGGIHQRPLAPWRGEALVREVRETLGSLPDHADARQRAVWQRDLCIMYGDAVADMLEHAHPTRITTAEGHALEPTVDCFELLRTLPTIRKALRLVPGLSPAHREDGVESFVLLETDVPHTADAEPPSAFGPSVLAEVRLVEQALLVSSNSVARADRVRAMLETALGARIRFMERTVTSSDEVMARFGELAAERDRMGDPTRARHATRDGIFLMSEDGADEIEPPIDVQEALRSRMAAESKRWVDLHVPALDGHTPREAMRMPALREKVVALLNDMEYRSRGLPAWQTMDVDLMRRELRLR